MTITRFLSRSALRSAIGASAVAVFVATNSALAVAEGEWSSLLLPGYGDVISDPGIVPYGDGWALIADGSIYGCPEAAGSKFANYRMVLDRDGNAIKTLCSPRPSAYIYSGDDIYGGSLTATPAGYAYATLGYGIYHYIEAFDRELIPLHPTYVVDTGEIFGAPIEGRPPRLIGTSRSIVEVNPRNVVIEWWAEKSRFDPDGTNRTMQAPLNPGFRNQRTNPGTVSVAGAWNGETVAAVFPESDPDLRGAQRLRIRFLDADSVPLGSSKTIANYPLSIKLNEVSIAATPTGWAVLSSQRIDNQESDLWLLFLDKSGALLRSQRLTPKDGVNSSGLSRRQELRIGDNGTIGVMYQNWSPNGFDEFVYFMELDLQGNVLREPTQIPEPPIFLRAGSLAYSNGRWGVVWYDGWTYEFAFTWYASRKQP